MRSGRVVLNDNGRIAYDHWHVIPGHHGHVEVHSFTIMPDHIHGIIELMHRPRTLGVGPTTGMRPLGPLPGSLGAIVGSYRAGVVREMNRIRTSPINGLWQRGYHDIIIRDDRALEHITRYIARHPAMVLAG